MLMLQLVDFGIFLFCLGRSREICSHEYTLRDCSKKQRFQAAQKWLLQWLQIYVFVGFSTLSRGMVLHFSLRVLVLVFGTVSRTLLI